MFILRAPHESVFASLFLSLSMASASSLSWSMAAQAKTFCFLSVRRHPRSCRKRSSCERGSSSTAPVPVLTLRRSEKTPSSNFFWASTTRPDCSKRNIAARTMSVPVMKKLPFHSTQLTSSPCGRRKRRMLVCASNPSVAECRKSSSWCRPPSTTCSFVPEFMLMAMFIVIMMGAGGSHELASVKPPCLLILCVTCL